MTRIALAIAVVCLVGCARPHLDGRASRAWWTQQRVHQKPASGKPAGLDSEEAALVHARYRESLGGARSKAAAASPVMVLPNDPNARDARGPAN